MFDRITIFRDSNKLRTVFYREKINSYICGIEFLNYRSRQHFYQTTLNKSALSTNVKAMYK